MPSVPTWKDGSVTPRSLAELESRMRAGVIYPEDFGAIGGGSGADDTAAINAALAATDTYHPRVYLGNPPYWASQILMKAYSGLEGPMMSTMSLIHLPGFTGPLLREITPAEGNANGASGLWMRNLALHGNGLANEDGISIGMSSSNLSLNFLSSLDNVHTRLFGGTGMIINQNAAHCGYLWSVSNKVGAELHGESNHYGALWCEGNSDTNLKVTSSFDTFDMIHTEGLGTIVHMNISGGQNIFKGTTNIWGTNAGDKIVIITNSGNMFFGARFKANPAGSLPFNHGLYFSPWGLGTGPQQLVPFWIDASAAANWPGFLFDGFDGLQTKLGAVMFQSAGPITTAVVSQVTRNAAAVGSRFNAVTAGRGAMLYDVTLEKPVWSDGTIWQLSDGTAAP